MDFTKKRLHESNQYRCRESNTMKTRTIFLVFTAATLTGCLGTDRYTDLSYPPTTVESVEVIDLHQIQHKYEIIGEVSCNTEFGSVRVLRQKAAVIGANAISLPDHRGSDIIVSQAIRYKD